MGTKVNEIIIFVGGGLVQDIQNIPAGVRVLVRDYDVEGSVCPEEAQIDASGEPYFECDWSPEVSTDDTAGGDQDHAPDVAKCQKMTLLSRTMKRLVWLETENQRLRTGCEFALGYFTEKFRGRRTLTGDVLRAALAAGKGGAS